MKVKNRSASRVGYTIPDLNLKRVFAPGETKEISKEELDKLAYVPGGLYILINFLQVEKEEANQFDFNKEREYHFSEEEVKDLILNGSLDEFLDALDFAPKGVIDLIKEYAVSLPMADMNKADALRAATGFDAVKAYQNQKLVEEDDGFKSAVNGVPEGKKRRASSKEDTEPAAAPARRTDKYKIIEQN